MLRKSKLIIPFAPVEELMKENTNLKVSKDAVEALTEELIYFGKKVSEKAWELAKHSGRKTIKDSDIKLAYEHLYKLR